MAMTDYEALYREEEKIVSRIWEQLGSPTYQSLNGKSIHDLIESQKLDAYQAGYLAGLQQAQADEAVREKFVVTFGVEYD